MRLFLVAVRLQKRVSKASSTRIRRFSLSVFEKNTRPYGAYLNQFRLSTRKR